MGVFVSNFNFYLSVMRSSQEEEEEENSEEETPFKPKLPLKLLLCYTLLIQGLYRYIPGPIMNDISVIVKEKITPIVFTVRAIGCIVGLITGSIVHQYLLHSNNRILLIFLSSFLMSVTAFGTAMSKTFTEIKISFAAAGFCLGAIISGVNGLYLHTSMLPTKTFCLTLYFFYGIGALLAPMLTREHFIHTESSEFQNTTQTKNITRVRLNRPEIKSPMDNLEAFFKSFPVSFTATSYAYFIACFLIFIESLLWLASFCIRTGTAEQVPRIDEKEEDVVFKNLSIFVASLTCFISESLVFSYAEILPVIYSVAFEPSPRQTAEIMAFYLGCLCVSRLMAIIISWKIKPHNMRILGITFVIAGCIIWYIYESGDVMYFWIANGFIGLGAGPLFGSAHTWIADIFTVKHLYILPFFLMSAFSELFMPWSFCLTANQDYPRVKLILTVLSLIYCVLLLLQLLIVYKMNQMRKNLEGGEKRHFTLAEILPVSLRRRFIPKHKETVDQEDSTAQEQQPEGNPHEVFNRMSDLKKRLSHNTEDVKQTLNQLHYSVSNK